MYGDNRVNEKPTNLAEIKKLTSNLDINVYSAKQTKCKKEDVLDLMIQAQEIMEKLNVLYEQMKEEGK